MTTKKYPWIEEARKYIGLTEVKGQKNSTVITGWLGKLNAWWTNDETPWCGVYVAHCIQSANLTIPKHWYRAKDWLNWGITIASPAYGAVVVFERKGGGHVGFVVGIDKLGNILVLGGNQGDAVNIRAFPVARVAGYRWPSEVPLPVSYQLVLGAGELSTTEA